MQLSYKHNDNTLSFRMQIPILNSAMNLISQEHLGAGEACRAHNPEVRRSKLRGATFFHFVMDYLKRVLGFHKTPPVLVEACLYELDCIIDDVIPPKGRRV